MAKLAHVELLPAGVVPHEVHQHAPISAWRVLGDAPASSEAQGKARKGCRHVIRYRTDTGIM
jgi:hypothetical protein